MAVMFKGLIVVAGFAASLSAQKTEVANGYHVVHPETTASTAPASPEKAGKNATKKSTMKKHHIKKA